MMAEKKPERKNLEAGKHRCWPGGFGAHTGPIDADLDLETNQGLAPSGELGGSRTPHVVLT